MDELFGLEHIQKFLKGVNRFYTHFERRLAANQIIWQEGSTHVLDYTQVAKDDLPILFFIPSLINKSYILDLIKDMSMVKYFANLGYRVYLVDFTEPLDDELNMSFADYEQRLNRAINEVCKNSPIVTIGYCLGGLFSLKLQSNSKANFIGQALIATPWDFSHFKNILGLSSPLIMQNFELIVSGLDKVSPALVQWFFSAIDPYKIWNKFSKFASIEESQEVEKFVAVEQWVNDGISLSKKFALEALSMLNSKEPFFNIDCKAPSLIIGGEMDKIVPPSSYMKLYGELPNKELKIKKTGHIGLVVGTLAKEEIWLEIENWLQQKVVRKNNYC